MTIVSREVDLPATAREAPAEDLTPRERELGAIIHAYNQVTEQLKHSHELLTAEVKRLREELAGKNRQLERRKRLAALGELAAGVAHEIRNPLGGIRLFASLLQRDLKDRPDARRVVDKIIQGVTTLESIVTDILDFARPPEAVPGPVHLAHLVAEVVELAGPRIEAAGVKVEVAPELESVQLVTDKAMLQRALLNLLFNAVDAAAMTADEGRVTVGLADGVRSSNGEDEVVLSVRDNGPGIPEQALDKIFNPFFTTKDKGTGLGLAVVHQMAEALGGFVRVASSSAEGTEFVLGVPRRLSERMESDDT